MKSTTKKTLKECRRRGWVPLVVEKWNQNVRRKSGPGVGFGIRQDLGGWMDIIAQAPGIGLIGIQSTSYSGKSSHLKKLMVERRREVGHWIACPGGIAQLWVWKGEQLQIIDLPDGTLRQGPTPGPERTAGSGVGSLDQWLGS